MKRRVSRWLWRAALALLVPLAVGELGLRYVLLGKSAWAAQLGASLRLPGYFCDAQVGHDYWYLAARLRPPTLEPVLDPLLGWRSRHVDAAYGHADMHSLAGRRPILLFGDSFARCLTPKADCFDGLVERSDLAASFALINYGTGGYGLDQILLSAERALPHWRERDAVAVVAILVDDDLDRCDLAFRQWPRPHFDLEHGELTLQPPSPLSNDEWFAANGPFVRSYLWRLALHHPRFVPRRWRALLDGREASRAAKRARLEALTPALLARLDALFQAQEVPYCVLLFHGVRELRQPRGSWREALLTGELDALGIPFVRTRDELEGALASSKRPLEALFEASHYTPESNQLAFRVLRRGLERLGLPAGE